MTATLEAPEDTGYPRRFRILNLAPRRDLEIVAYGSGEWESRPRVGAVLHTDEVWDFEVGHRFGRENKADVRLGLAAGTGAGHVDVEFDVDAFGTPWASVSASSGVCASVSGSTVILTSAG
ncbi:hypothetical protein ACFQH9_07190 [Pseudonocardia lutea]|uniref:Uncharacterized protein n=1 Tax=Pseudonocardia lutea TaxID=2172015 RepID=A0ABW1I5S9_9PSEU